MCSARNAPSPRSTSPTENTLAAGQEAGTAKTPPSACRRAPATAAERDEPDVGQSQVARDEGRDRGVGREVRHVVPGAAAARDDLEDDDLHAQAGEEDPRDAHVHPGQARQTIIDLDRFKEINDTLGHHYGDEVLRQVATRLQAGIGAADTVARLGGDEFAILLPQPASPRDVLAVAARLREALGEPVDAAGVRLEMGGSVGVARYPGDGADVETLLQRADVARSERSPAARASSATPATWTPTPSRA